ncbi:MAG: 3'-5' exonuclease [Ruminococcaceae bacterium]|nr:3'-5' exonuclease [Oscillospiraceae bacterium]
MKILFFDMEFANGKIPGSVYSLGYVETNHKFQLTQPQTDLLMNPDCEWNSYVRQHILAYPMRTVRAAALFPSYYKRLKRLLCHADLVVGFAVKNDTGALRAACERYGLKPLAFRCLDLEKLCRALGDHPQAHGLSGYVRAYCGIDPENQHRSDGDAYATMLLLREICQSHRISPKQIKTVFASHFVESLPPAPVKIRKKKRGEEIAVALPQAPASKRKPNGNRNRRKPRPVSEPAAVPANRS